MSRSCFFTGKRFQSGHNVSHSNRRTNRRFDINIHNVSLYSEILKGKLSSVRITSSTMRDIAKAGGIDEYLLNISVRKLTKEGQKVRRMILSRYNDVYDSKADIVDRAE